MKFFGIETKGKVKRFYFLGIPLYSTKKDGYATKRRLLFFRSTSYNYRQMQKDINALTKSSQTQDKIIAEIKSICRNFKKESQSTNKNISILNNISNIISSSRSSLNTSAISHKKKILYITDYLLEIGGTETRLLHLFDFMERNGYECIIMTGEGNYLTRIKKYRNITLNFNANNFQKHLHNFIKENNIDVIEFQAKGIDYFPNINFYELRKIVKVGLCIHNNLNFEKIHFNDFHYKFRTVSTMGHDFLEKIQRIPNWIVECHPIWRYKSQKRAIFISRLNDNEKAPTLKSFISICQRIGCDFSIAGNVKGKTKTSEIVANLDEHHYIGVIDTLQYLQENADNVLFVGGVGQVPMEAASLGIPALVCTHHQDYTKSRFVTNENMNFMIENNFVINHHIPQSESGNLSCFITAISRNDFTDFDVISSINEKLSENTVLEDYLTMINN